MAIPITFSDKDLLRGKIVTPAWYRMRIDEIGEKASKDGGSTNYPVNGVILFNGDNGSTEFTGVPIIWNFNSKAQGLMVGFLACFGVEVKAGQRYDLQAAQGKELDVYVENGTYENRIVNRVEHKYRQPKQEVVAVG